MKEREQRAKAEELAGALEEARGALAVKERKYSDFETSQLALASSQRSEAEEREYAIREQAAEEIMGLEATLAGLEQSFREEKSHWEQSRSEDKRMWREEVLTLSTHQHDPIRSADPDLLMEGGTGEGGEPDRAAPRE